MDVKPGLTPDELQAIIGDYDGLAIRSATKVTADLLALPARLKVVGRAGIGVDNVDVEAATEAGVVVMNTPFGNSVTTAEHAIALMMALARQMPAADRSTRAGKWEKSRFIGVELAGKTLGLIGCGNIGSIVADRAQGLKMRVIAYDPFLSPERAADLGRREGRAGRAARARRLHHPAHAADRADPQHAVGREPAADQKGVRIVNCARGGLVDEAALAALIETGHVAGAALDVFAAGAGPRIAAVRPRAGDRHAASRRLDRRGAGEGGAPDRRADGRLPAHRRGGQRAQHAVGERRGGAPAQALHEARRAARQLRRAADRDRARGRHHHLCRPGRAPQHQAADRDHARGPAGPLLASVNMVNAPAVARGRDIDVTTVETEDLEGYQTLIRSRSMTERGQREVVGTLFHERPAADRRASAASRSRPSSPPHMLYVSNEDKPGFIGALGSVLGDAGINIATFHLGRERPGGDAIALIEVDAAVPEAKVLKPDPGAAPRAAGQVAGVLSGRQDQSAKALMRSMKRSA